MSYTGNPFLGNDGVWPVPIRFYFSFNRTGVLRTTIMHVLLCHRKDTLINGFRRAFPSIPTIPNHKKTFVVVKLWVSIEGVDESEFIKDCLDLRSHLSITKA